MDALQMLSWPAMRGSADSACSGSAGWAGDHQPGSISLGHLRVVSDEAEGSAIVGRDLILGSVCSGHDDWVAFAFRHRGLSGNRFPSPSSGKDDEGARADALGDRYESLMPRSPLGVSAPRSRAYCLASVSRSLSLMARIGICPPVCLARPDLRWRDGRWNQRSGADRRE